MPLSIVVSFEAFHDASASTTVKTKDHFSINHVQCEIIIVVIACCVKHHAILCGCFEFKAESLCPEKRFNRFQGLLFLRLVSTECALEPYISYIYAKTLMGNTGRRFISIDTVKFEFLKIIAYNPTPLPCA